MKTKFHETAFNFSFEIYLKNAQKSDYLKINGVSKLISAARLMPNAFQELKTKQEISYEIEEPASDTYSQIQSENTATPKNDNDVSISLSENVNR